MNPRACRTWVVLAFALAAVPALPQTPQGTFEGIHRVVAIGDVHGDYPRFLEILRTAELIRESRAGRAGLLTWSSQATLWIAAMLPPKSWT